VSVDKKIHPIIPAVAEDCPGKAGEIRTSNGTETEPASRPWSPPPSQELDRESTEPEMNMERVEQIKRAIREGRFQVNAKAVAQKLLETVKETLKSYRA